MGIVAWQIVFIFANCGFYPFVHLLTVDVFFVLFLVFCVLAKTNPQCPNPSPAPPCFSQRAVNKDIRANDDEINTLVLRGIRKSACACKFSYANLLINDLG